MAHVDVVHFFIWLILSHMAAGGPANCREVNLDNYQTRFLTKFTFPHPVSSPLDKEALIAVCSVRLSRIAGALSLSDITCVCHKKFKIPDWQVDSGRRRSFPSMKSR